MKLKTHLVSLFTLAVFPTINLFAQIHDTSFFVVKGKIINTNEKKWELAKTSFFDNKSYQIPISGDGSFCSSIPTDSIQDVYLYLNDDAITIYACPGDTIELNWDEKDFNNTFTVKSRVPTRNIDLQANMKDYKVSRESSLSLRQKLYTERKVADSLKYKWINEHFNKQLQSVLEDTTFYTPNTGKFVTDIYYSHINLLRNNNLLDLYILRPDTSFINPFNSLQVRYYLKRLPDYKRLNYSDFCISPEYRDFILNYVRFERPFNYSVVFKPEERVPFSPVRNDYYRVMANIDVFTIRDWLATNIIMSGFNYYPFEECESVLNEFLMICKNQTFKDTLINFYDFIKKFKPGQPAPDFILKDENDKNISLSSFKGKVVYIDFWGVGCAPCRSDIDKYVPKLHQKYHDKDVVFINVCVDSNEETWKKAIADLKLDGVNLIAEGWTSNPICNLYNINGIPHYIILDKQGRFYEYNGARPWELVNNNKNSLDYALEN